MTIIEETIKILNILDIRYVTFDKDERKALALAIKLLKELNENCVGCKKLSWLDKKYDTYFSEDELQESEIERASDKCPICIHRNNSCQFGLDCHFKEQKF